MDKELMSYEVCSSSPPQRRNPTLFSEDNIDVWQWHDMQPVQRETFIGSADNLMNHLGFNCPYFKPKELARIPIAVWIFTVTFNCMYTLGRMITIMGKRICE